MEGLSQTGAILHRAKIAQALAGSEHVESLHISRFRPEDWTVAIHIAAGETALKVTVAHLAELYDGNVHLYNPQLVNESQLEALVPQVAA